MKLRLLTIALIPLLASAAQAAKDSCFDCHSVMEGTSVVFKDDVHYHNTISCADCHGGDPKEDDQNVSMNADRGFKIRVTRQETPDYCGRCHSDAKFMGKFNPQQRVDQLALYRTGVHGRQLAAGQTKAAECVDCHSVHNIRAVSDPLSTVNPQILPTPAPNATRQRRTCFGKARTGGCSTPKKGPAAWLAMPVTPPNQPPRPCSRAQRPSARDVTRPGPTAKRPRRKWRSCLPAWKLRDPAQKRRWPGRASPCILFDVDAVKQAAAPAAASKLKNQTQSRLKN